MRISNAGSSPGSRPRRQHSFEVRLMGWRANKPDEVGPAPADVDEHLSRLPIFAAAETTEIDHLAAGSELARYSAGRQVIREGRIPSHLFVALEGDLEV